MNNTPTLTQSEEERAPWNQKTRKIAVNISQCLSSTQEIEIPEDLDDPELLEMYVRKQIVLPSDCLEINGHYDWYVDDFCVME